MISSIVIAPTFLRPSCAVGQIERHFFPNMSEDFYSHIICVEDELQLKGNSFRTYAVPERWLVLKVDLVCRELGLTDLVYSPDSTYYSWCKRALKKASSIVKDNHIDYILTVNNPVSAHLVGYQLKKKYGIPWVAQFYDPWCNNPFRKYHHSFCARVDAKRERLVAEHADLIIFPNHELLESWVEAYGDEVAKKLCVIPFTTAIPNLEGKSFSEERQVLTISHIGTLSEKRRPDVFFRAISRLFKQHPEDKGKLKVDIVGCISKNDKDLITQEGIENTVNVIGRLSEEECLQYYETADVFLIIDINCSPNLFYPSKLLKYFAFRKPIVGLTKKGSVVAHELSITGNASFDYDDFEGLSEYLHRAINDYDSINHNDKSYYRRFLVENTRSLFQDHLSKMLIR